MRKVGRRNVENGSGNRKECGRRNAECGKWEGGMWKTEVGIEKNAEVGMRNAEWKRMGKWECGMRST